MKNDVCVLGIFVADTAYVAKRLPRIGETLTGSAFSVGPGGKGSNQAVAAARAGAKVSFISKIGTDSFGDLAVRTFASERIRAELLAVSGQPTGAAFIYVDENTGDNAIIVYPGAAGTLSTADVESKARVIEKSKIFVTQLEQPVEAALRGLEIARAAGATTIFNPAPAIEFPATAYTLCDFFIPNETEAAALVGYPLEDLNDAQRAGDELLQRGVGTAVITLGARGVLFHTYGTSLHVPAISYGPAIDTAGAGDAFIGALSAGLAEDMSPVSAVRFACAAAGIAVTTRGTAAAMPLRQNIEQSINAAQEQLTKRSAPETVDDD